MAGDRKHDTVPTAALSGAAAKPLARTDASTRDDGEHLAPATLLGDRYKIVRFVARGGMGDVYEAIDTELRTTVAVKTVRSYLAADPSALDRVRREVQLARMVTHPNVCRIFDLGRADVGGRQVTYITMELLDGISLRRRLSGRGVMSTTDALPLVVDILGGLDACHHANVVHRDLKPENILLVPRDDREHAVLTDFGIARPNIDPSPDEVVTRDGVLVGSVAYMAPELLDGARPTAQSDLFGVGAIMWEITVGTWPLRELETIEIMRTYARGGPLATPLPEHLDPTWANVIRRCLAAVPQRFNSAWEILELLSPGVARRRSSKVTPRPETPVPLRADTAPSVTVATTQSKIRKRRRARRLLLIAAAVAAVATAIGVVVTRHHTEPASGPQAAATTTVDSVRDALARLEFARALQLTQSLDDRVPAALRSYLEARAQAGLGNWAAARAAVDAATQARDGLDRKMSLQLEAISDRCQGKLLAVPPVLDAMFTTWSDDPELGLDDAEALLSLGNRSDAARVLDKVSGLSLTPVLTARFALDRLVLLYQTTGSNETELQRLAEMAITAAKAVDAKVMQGRALAILAKSSMYRGLPDEAAADIKRAIALLDESGDRFGMAFALYVRANVAQNTSSDANVPLGFGLKAVEASKAVDDRPTLCLSEHSTAMSKLELGQVQEAFDAEHRAIQACADAHRDDIADTRAWPGMVEIDADLGHALDGLKILDDLHVRRGPDREGREEQNYVKLYRYRGDLAHAREHAQIDESVLDKSNQQNLRACLYLEQALVAYEADDLRTHAEDLAKGDAMLKAAGAEADEEVALLFVRVTPLIDRDPTAAIELLEAPHALTSWGRGMFTLLEGRALLKLGKREAASGKQAAYRAVAAFDQYDELRVQARILDSELADTAEARSAAARELAAASDQARVDGFQLAQWRADLALAALDGKAGDAASARKLATRVQQEASSGGCLRLAREAQALLSRLGR
jgi:hypothetical protein